MSVSQLAGWEVEGLEVNPKTAACAQRRTGAIVHRVSIDAIAGEGRHYTAVTLTDVLEHIPDPYICSQRRHGCLLPAASSR